jgi:cytochrome c oxidase subunit 6b
MPIEKPLPLQVKTAGFNPHFPNQNQTKHCFLTYINYKYCLEKKGEE